MHGHMHFFSAAVWPPTKKKKKRTRSHPIFEDLIIPLLIPAHTCTLMLPCVFIIHVTRGATDGFAVRTEQSHYLFDNESYLFQNKVSKADSLFIFEVKTTTICSGFELLKEV